MIDTMMVLWNRGYSSRALLAFLAFFVICISISLLLVTVDGVWWHSLPQQGSGRQQGVVVVASPTTMTTPTMSATEIPVATATSTIRVPAHRMSVLANTTNVCFMTATRGASSPTRGQGKGDDEDDDDDDGSTDNKASPTPIPIVKITVTPGPRPHPTITVTGTPRVQPTQAAKANKRVKKHHRDAGDDDDAKGVNCLSDSVGIGGDVISLSTLGRYLWLILGGSGAGTLLFCGVMYRMSRRRLRKR